MVLLKAINSVLSIQWIKLKGCLRNKGASLMAQQVKNPPTKQETQVWSLGQEDPLKWEMATHFSVLAWRIPWTEEPDRLQSMGLQRVRHNWATNTHTHTHTHTECALKVLLIYSVIIVHMKDLIRNRRPSIVICQKWLFFRP